MKTVHINPFRIVFNCLLLAMLLTNACAQSDKKETAKSEVKAPTMDLQAAVLSNNLDVVKQHIAAGTDINKKDPLSGSTPLITAVTFDKPYIVEALIKADADLNRKNNDGSTALHCAAFFGRIEMVQLLIDVKADKTVKNNFGATARETVMGPFTDVKPIYDMLQQQLGPIGLQLDLEEIEKARPVIAIMLQ